LARQMVATFSFLNEPPANNAKRTKNEFLMGGPFDFGYIDTILEHLP